MSAGIDPPWLDPVDSPPSRGVAVLVAVAGGMLVVEPAWLRHGNARSGSLVTAPRWHPPSAAFQPQGWSQSPGQSMARQTSGATGAGAGGALAGMVVVVVSGGVVLGGVYDPWGYATPP